MLFDKSDFKAFTFCYLPEDVSEMICHGTYVTYRV